MVIGNPSAQQEQQYTHQHTRLCKTETERQCQSPEFRPAKQLCDHAHNSEQVEKHLREQKQNVKGGRQQENVARKHKDQQKRHSVPEDSTREFANSYQGIPEDIHQLPAVP
jgi:hypothetical protein